MEFGVLLKPAEHPSSLRSFGMTGRSLRVREHVIPKRSEGSPVEFEVSPETSRRSLLAALVWDDTICVGVPEQSASNSC